MARTPHRRPGEISPGTPEAAGIGLDDKTIPGGQPHIENQPVARPALPAVTHKPYYGGIMAHGVPAEPEDAGESWKRLSAPGGKSLRDLAREHGMTAGGLVEAARASAGAPGGLTRSELDEFARQLAAGTGQPLDAGLVYVIPLHSALGRITGAFHTRPAAAATGAADPIERRRPDPVPVYMVTEAGGPQPLTLASPRRMDIPAPGGDPARIGGMDPHQSGLLLLNESATAIRIGAEPGGVVTYGAMLPASMTSYLRLATQAPLFAVTDGTGATSTLLSVITEFARPGPG